MYITVEGVIGAGKTTLTTIIAKELSSNSFYEIVEENPFLEKFYENQEKWAFQTEMFFLTSRYQQLKEIDNILKNDEKVVADYNIMKNLIFAKETLNDFEYDKFLTIFNTLIQNMSNADLIIVIDSSLKTLKKNIKKRGREYEESISDSYLEHLIQAYKSYITLIKQSHQEKLLIIDGDGYDFVNNNEDYEEIMRIINNKIGALSE